MQLCLDRDGLPAFVNFLWMPGVTPGASRRKIDRLRALALLPNRRDEDVRAVKIGLPVLPGRFSLRVHEKERPHYRHACLVRFFCILVTVINQTLVQARIESPDGD